MYVTYVGILGGQRRAIGFPALSITGVCVLSSVGSLEEQQVF